MNDENGSVEVIRDFLKCFSKIIDKVIEEGVVSRDDELVTKTTDMYPNLSETDKDSVLQTVRSFGDYGYGNRLFFDLFCFHYYRDLRFADDIADVLLSCEMDYREMYNYMVVQNRELFLAGMGIDYAKRLAVEDSVVGMIKDGIPDFPAYIPYDKRTKKKVVMILAPFIGIYHAPSQKAINFDMYLEKLGYSVFYISVNDNDILSSHSADLPFVFGNRNVLFDGVKEFEYNCFGRVIKGLHFDLRNDHMITDLGFLTDYIAGINPEFVIGIENCNILADLCTYYTDVVSINMVDDLPITLSKYVLRMGEGEYHNDYKNAKAYGKIVMDAAFSDIILPFNRSEDDYSLPDDRFLICIMGNRLDLEVDKTMQEKIRELIRDVPEADILFIGECPRLKESLSDISFRCHFPGYINRCEDAVAACSLFLNPPRTGGGGGGCMAIRFGVPVYTLDDCDVSSYVGDEFIHDSYDELIPFVKRCAQDTAFYERMQSKAKEYYDLTQNVDSLGNIRDFIERFSSVIKGES